MGPWGKRGVSELGCQRRSNMLSVGLVKLLWCSCGCLGHDTPEGDIKYLVGSFLSC